MLFYIFYIVSETHEKPQTKSALVCLIKLSHFPSLSVAHSPEHNLFQVKTKEIFPFLKTRSKQEQRRRTMCHVLCQVPWHKELELKATGLLSGSWSSTSHLKGIFDGGVAGDQLHYLHIWDFPSALASSGEK